MPFTASAGQAADVDSPDELLGLRRVAEIVRTTRSTVARYILLGELPATSIDGRFYVRRGDAETFARRFKRPPWSRGPRAHRSR